jgi:DNA adenine methylase
MRYPGGKGGAGVYQTIINQIPHHHTYIETHLGGGNIMARKKPASENLGIDIDHQQLERWAVEYRNRKDVRLVAGCAHEWLLSRFWEGGEFVYCDPPYVMETRKSGPIYRHEYSDSQHRDLIRILRSLPCMVMVSGYPSDLYDKGFQGWRRMEFKAMTRGGPATEVLWMNYPEPEVPHDLSYAGKDYRERERIKRKRDRWAAKFQAMPPLERAVIAAALNDAAADGVPAVSTKTTGMDPIAKNGGR